MSSKPHLCVLVALALLPAAGCKKKAAETQQSPAAMNPTPGQAAARPTAPRRRVAERSRPSPRDVAHRRDAPARAVAWPAGTAAPPAEVTKTLGQTPGMMMRANLTAWWASPLTAPLLASSHGMMKKAFGACAGRFPLRKLTKAFFVQSAAQLMRRARDIATDSHYIVFAADFDVPALFACLAKAGTYKAVRLGGATAYQATKTPDTRKHPGTKESWWFAPTPRSLVIVDGPWAKKVTPGKGPLGTGAWLKHVGPEALRAWATKMAPDLLAVKGFLNLSPDVHGRAELTWRDAKDARAVANSLRSPTRLPAFLAPVVRSFRVSVQGKKLNVSIRVPATQAKVLGALLGKALLSGGSGSSPPRAERRRPVATDKAPLPPRPPAAAKPPTAPRPPTAPKPPKPGAAPRPRPRPK